MKFLKCILASVAVVALIACGQTTEAKPAKKTAPVEVLAKGQKLNPAHGKTTVIDFNATWCGPCKMFAPTFDEVAAEFKGKARFVSIDIDQHPELAQKYGIRAIPTIVTIAPDGSVQSFTGLMEKDQFTTMVKAAMEKKATSKKVK